MSKKHGHFYGFAALFLAAIFSLTFLACEEEAKDDGPPNQLSGSGKSVKFTGLSAFDGKFVMVQGQTVDGKVFTGLSKLTTDGATLIKIASGSVTVPLYIVDTSNRTYTAYNGTDANVSFGISIYNDEFLATSNEVQPTATKAASGVSFSGNDTPEAVVR